MEDSQTIRTAGSQRFWGREEVAGGKGSRGSQCCHGNTNQQQRTTYSCQTAPLIGCHEHHMQRHVWGKVHRILIYHL